MGNLQSTFLLSRITALTWVFKLLSYPVLSDFRKDVTFWKVPRLCPFVFLGKASCSWRWVLYFCMGRRYWRCCNPHTKSMCSVWRQCWLLCTSGRKWTRKAGRSAVDAERSGRASRSSSDVKLEESRGVFLENGRVTTAGTASGLNSSQGSGYLAGYSSLGYHQVCTEEVARQFVLSHGRLPSAPVTGCVITAKVRTHCAASSQVIWLWFIVTYPKTKRHRTYWKHTTAPVHNKFKSWPSDGKVRLTVFGDS